jgi:hypothetical protein
MAARNDSSDVSWSEHGVYHAGISDTPVMSEKSISRNTAIVEVLKEKKRVLGTQWTFARLYRMT